MILLSTRDGEGRAPGRGRTGSRLEVLEVKSKLTSKLTVGMLAAAAAWFAFATQPVEGHHSFAAEFDINKPMTLRGVVSKVNWQNPHVYVYLDTTDADGKMVTYALECNSVNTLVHKGWTRDALKKGDEVIVSAYGSKDPRPLRDGSYHANARSIAFVDGSKELSAVSSAGEKGGKGK